MERTSPLFDVLGSVGNALELTLPATGGLDTDIVLVFDRDIDDRTAPLVVAGGVAIAASYAVAGNTLTITPNADLSPATVYQVQTGYIRDLSYTQRWQGYQSFTTQ